MPQDSAKQGFGHYSTKFLLGMSKYLDYAKGENLKNKMPLWVKPDNKLSVYDVMNSMRDHYRGNST